MAQRDEIRATLGQQWWQALLLSAGRLFSDYLCLAYWAPLAAGPIAYGLFRLRYRHHSSPP